MSVEKRETCTARCPWRLGAPFSSVPFGGQLCLGASRLPWETALPDAGESGFCLVLPLRLDWVERVLPGYKKLRELTT